MGTLLGVHPIVPWTIDNYKLLYHQNNKQINRNWSFKPFTS